MVMRVSHKVIDCKCTSFCSRNGFALSVVHKQFGWLTDHNQTIKFNLCIKKKNKDICHTDSNNKYIQECFVVPLAIRW